MDPSMKRMRSAVEEEKEDGKEITIYLRVTKTVTLNMKESDSVGTVKALLHDKEGIPIWRQELFSEDNWLLDGQKLVDYGICENSTLNANVKGSSPMIILFVKRSYAEDAISVYARIYDTIRDVKSRIGAKERIKSYEFSLMHDGMFLEDDKTLAFLKIDDESTLYMVLSPRDKFLISVEMPNDNVVRIEVRATLFVRDVKTVIESKIGESMNDNDLFMGKQKLEDQKALYQYGIKEDSHLLVVSGIMQIFIRKCMDGESITLNVHRHDLVKDVKGVLLNKLGIPVHLQKLMFEGKGLADSRDLSSYKIHRESILYLEIPNYTENPTHGTPQMGLPCQMELSSVIVVEHSVMNHSDDAEDSRTNMGDTSNLIQPRRSNRVKIPSKRFVDYVVEPS